MIDVKETPSVLIPHGETLLLKSSLTRNPNPIVRSQETTTTGKTGKMLSVLTDSLRSGIRSKKRPSTRERRLIV